MIGEQSIVGREIRYAIALAFGGRTGLVTLTASVASTTLTNPLIRFDSPILLQPTTANAAAEIGAGTMYISETGRVNGSAVIVHANNAQTDRTFRLFVG